MVPRARQGMYGRAAGGSCPAKDEHLFRSRVSGFSHVSSLCSKGQAREIAA